MSHFWPFVQFRLIFWPWKKWLSEHRWLMWSHHRVKNEVLTFGPRNCPPEKHQASIRLSAPWQVDPTEHQRPTGPLTRANTHTRSHTGAHVHGHNHLFIQLNIQVIFRLWREDQFWLSTNTEFTLRRRGISTRGCGLSSSRNSAAPLWFSDLAADWQTPPPLPTHTHTTVKGDGTLDL